MKAFDVHVHPSTRGLDHHACGYFKRNLADIPQTPESFAAIYAKNDVQALLIGWHPSTVNEGSRNSNEHVLELAEQFPDTFPESSRPSTPMRTISPPSRATPRSWCGTPR